MAIEVLQFIQPWYDGEDPVAESFENFRRIRRRNLRPKQKQIDNWTDGAAESLVHKFESKTDYGFITTRAKVDHPAKLTQTTSIVEPSWIETINVPNWFIKHNTIMGVRIMISNAESIMARSLVLFCLATLTRLMGHIRVPQFAVVALTQKGHSQETDGHN